MVHQPKVNLEFFTCPVSQNWERQKREEVLMIRGWITGSVDGCEADFRWRNPIIPSFGMSVELRLLSFGLD